MSDDMGTHKQGRRRRAIRRLTQREIPLPVSASSPPVEYSVAPIADSTAPPAMISEEPTGAAPDPTVAKSLSELRLPEESSDSDADLSVTLSDIEPSINKRRDTEENPVARRPPLLATEELSEDEPATNPKLRFVSPNGSPEAADARDRQASLPPPIGSDRPKQGRRLDTPPPKAAGDAMRTPALAKSEDSEEETIEVETTDQEVDEPDVATGKLKKPDSSAAAANGGGSSGATSPNAKEPRRSDSDVPTRPRIELSDEMAHAAGRVTSLELSPLSPDGTPIKRGSKMPQSGEPRMISSLTGRRSSFPVSSEEDDESSRPSVVVTRSKVISDRPPKPDSEPTSVPSTAAKASPSERPLKPVEPETAEPADRVTAAPRPSRRPGTADTDDFETLDIEDGEAELQLTQSGDEALDGEAVTSKAPPPPPVKRAAVPAQVVPAPPPKAAPPPPPRTATSPITSASGTTNLAALSGVGPAAAAPSGANTAAAPAAAASTTNTAAGGATAAAAAAAPSKKSGSRQQRRRQWWETLFSDEYLRTVVRPTAAQIARQVDFMQASLGVSKGSSVLDVGCGLGQHALEFARRGSLVVALDLALPMITRAAEEAQQENLRINFLHKDIRDIGFEGTFDAVVCVGTTFGFFDDEQNREVLGRLATALKPGGRLLLEVVNRDHVLTSQPNLQWFEGDGCVVMEESDFNYYSSRLSVKRTMMREDGRQTESEYSIRLYSLHELGQMMQQVGFRVKEVSGQQATRGVFFGAQSNRIILLAERRTGPARGNGHSDAPAPPAEG